MVEIGKLHLLEKEEQKIIHKIFGLKQVERQYSVRSQMEIYSQIKKITDFMMKRRTMFYDHL